MPLNAGHYVTYSRDWRMNGAPTTMFVENIPRIFLTGNTAVLTTQVMASTPIVLEVGQVVTNLTFVSGATAAGTPTNWWFALYSRAATPALLAQSADQLTAAWAANTAVTLALATAQQITTSGTYWAAVMMKATTPNSLAGIVLENAAAAGALVAGQVVLSQTSGSALVATAPATIATPTTTVGVPYVVAT